MVDVHKIADIYTDLHFVFTSGTHGDSYANYRALGLPEHQSLLYETSVHLIQKCINKGALDPLKPIIIVGPETLGAKMFDEIMRAAGKDLPSVLHRGASGVMPFGTKQLWFSITDDLNNPETQVIFVDDLLNQGHTTRVVDKVIEKHFGLSITTIAVIGDRSGLQASEFNVEHVVSLEEFKFSVFDPTKESCRLCLEGRPIVRKPGHGFKFEEDHPDYFGGFIDL